MVARHPIAPLFAWLLTLPLATMSGCVTPPEMRLAQLEQSRVPRELDKATLPAYIVEPPDILVIQAVNMLRTPETPLRPGDRLRIQLKNGLPIDVGVDAETNPLQFNAELQIELGFKLLSGSYLVGADGTVDLGPAYGKVLVANLTTQQAAAAVREHLEQKIGLRTPELLVTLDDVETPQPIAGEHLVRPDGRISLGIYGEVFVAGMTLPEVKLAVEEHLKAFIQDPQVAVDVLAYNSKMFYIIVDGGGFGEQVIRLPYTGNETVLDAIAQIQGLSEVSSKRIWIARPAPSGIGVSQILEVAWEDITALGQTATNYQVLPGDRIYIQADQWISADNLVAKIVSPFERILGFTLLGVGTVQRIHFFNSFQAGGGRGF
jgi:polysaccharide export outer membrane protein